MLGDARLLKLGRHNAGHTGTRPRGAVLLVSTSTGNKWLNVLDSRAPYDAVPGWCAYGVTPEANAKQGAALDAMDAYVLEAGEVT